MKTIRQRYTIQAPVATVWQALVLPKVISSWGGGPAVMDAKPGTRFQLWGGDIHGLNREIVAEKKLVQDWVSGDWPQPSLVTFTLTPVRAGTRLELLHERVPDAEARDIAQGWKEYYLGPLKEYCESP